MAVNFTVWWLTIGFLIWIALDRLGITRASRHRDSAPHLFAATIVSIVIWPYFVWLTAQHPRGAVKWLKRNLWGRP